MVPGHFPSQTHVLCAPAGNLQCRLHAQLRQQQLPCRKLTRCAATASSGSKQGGNCKDFKVACFSWAQYARGMEGTIKKRFPQTTFLEARLDKDTAALAKGHDAVVLFVNDDASADVVEALQDHGVQFIAMRCAGFDRVDIKAANEKEIKVARVPTYSPSSVAEHSVSLALALNRNIVQAHNRVRQGNYTPSGLTGMELSSKTIGIVGTGAIGACAARIWKGFGARILAFDIKPNPEVEKLGVEYLPLEEVLANSDILSLHCPLNPKTFHIICADGIKKMKKGAMLVNCGRGGLVDTAALINSLENGDIGGAAMDVYERESKAVHLAPKRQWDALLRYHVAPPWNIRVLTNQRSAMRRSLFFQDFSQYTHKDRHGMHAFDRDFQLLLSFPNVIVTPHVAFLTTEALLSIANTTVQNLEEFAEGRELSNEVKPE